MKKYAVQFTYALYVHAETAEEARRIAGVKLGEFEFNAEDIVHVDVTEIDDDE